MKRAAIYFLTFIAVQLGIGASVPTVLRLFFPNATLHDPLVLTIVTGVAAIITLALFLLLRWCPVSRNYIRTRPWAVLAWTACLALGIIIPLTWVEELLPASWQVNLMGDEMVEMLHSSEGYFVVCMLAPLMEEVVFRGALIRALGGGWMAVCISAVLFAVAHFNPAQIPHALIVGTLLGWLFMKTGSIVPGLLVHWINNSAAYALVNLFPQLPADAHLADYVGGNQWAVARAVVCSLLICLPALYQLIKILEAPQGSSSR